MTKDLLTKYYKEAGVSWVDTSRGTKVQWMDNAPRHKVLPNTERALEHIKTQLWHFPHNNTHLTQPTDSFVINKIKDAWMRRWEEKNGITMG